MNKSTKISLLFFLIFLLGILGVFGLVNKTLNKKYKIEIYSITKIISINDPLDIPKNQVFNWEPVITTI
jgi:hypothetical protein